MPDSNTTVTTHRSPAGLQTDPVRDDSTYTSVERTTRSSSFGYIVGAAIAVLAVLLLFFVFAGPEGGETVGTGGDVATESAVAPADDPETAPVEQPAAEPQDAAPAAEEAAPAGDAGTTTSN